MLTINTKNNRNYLPKN